MPQALEAIEHINPIRFEEIDIQLSIDGRLHIQIYQHIVRFGSNGNGFSRCLSQLIPIYSCRCLTVESPYGVDIITLI